MLHHISIRLFHYLEIICNTLPKYLTFVKTSLIKFELCELRLISMLLLLFAPRYVSYY